MRQAELEGEAGGCLLKTRQLTGFLCGPNITAGQGRTLS
jgi:hypothetical protein